MDDYDDIEFEGPSVAFIAVEVYEHERGMAVMGSTFQGYFRCKGYIDVNPIMIETVEYIETDFTEYEKKTVTDRWLWWTSEKTVYEPHTTKVCFYKQILASGQVILTKQPILGGTGPRYEEDQCFEVKFDDTVRPLFGQELPGDPED